MQDPIQPTLGVFRAIRILQYGSGDAGRTLCLIRKLAAMRTLVPPRVCTSLWHKAYAQT